MTAAGDLLGPYFAASGRSSPNLAGRAGLHGTVDAALNELRIPCTVDGDGDWLFSCDIGQMALVVEADSGALVALQAIGKLGDRKAADQVELMEMLLLLNVETGGARFAATASEGATSVVITSRLAATAITTARLEAMLADVMALSRRLDEVTGKAPQQPAPAGWYPDPEGAPRTRYFDGERWTEHTSV